MNLPSSSRLAVAASVVAWLIGIAATAAHFHLRRSADPPEGRIEVQGVRAQVHIWSDSFAIPHVFARSEHDAWFAQGYLHAAHRLWQMELFRRAAAGRLAEMFGEDALAADRFVRTLDLWGIAEARLRDLAAAERAMLEAYAAGVNARLEQADGPLPPEFILIGIEPERWTPAASLAVGAVMSLDLAVWTHDLHRFRARAILPPEKYALLELPYPEWGPTTLPDSVPVPTLAEPGTAPGEPAPSSAWLGPTSAEPGRTSAHLGPSRANLGPSPPDPGPAPEHAGDGAAGHASGGAFGPFAGLDLLRRFSARSASNVWAVAASRGGGSALVANDMHLSLRAPALWYLAALHAEPDGLAVAGLTLPGVPGVIVGYNRGVAWGFSNGMVDDMDFVLETVNPAGEAYRAGDRWTPFAVRPETIRVRGRDEPEVLRVRSTLRGPLITDVLPDFDVPLSAMWVSPHSPHAGLAAMARATSFEAFDGAVRRFAAPHLNVVFAGRDGRIGYRLAGTLPLRDGWGGALPTSHAVVGPGWAGYWPRGVHPAGTDPSTGFYVSANNLQAPGLYGVLSHDYATPFRARRLTQRLESEASWSVGAITRLQEDVRSLLAERCLEAALAAAEAAGLPAAADTLRAWDRRASLGSHAAPIFHAWLYRLRTLLAADEYAAAGVSGGGGYFPLQALLRSIELGDAGPWVDDVGTPAREHFADLSARAMRDAVEVTGGRTWGEVHRERHRHPLGTIAWLDRLLGLNIGPYPVRGGSETVRSDDYSRWLQLDSASWTPPYISEYGPTERFVAELGPEGARGLFLLPTGQDGNPFSPHYRDMTERWRRGELIAVPLDSVDARARARREIELVPAADAETAPAEDGSGG